MGHPVPAGLKDEQFWLSGQVGAAGAIEFVNYPINWYAVPIPGYDSSLHAMTEDNHDTHLALSVLLHLGKLFNVSLHLDLALVLDSLTLMKVPILRFRPNACVTLESRLT